MPKPQNTIRVLLIRHGATADNGVGVVQGQRGGSLSELGRAQARAAAALVRREDPVAIYASDLARARETAELVAAALPGPPVVADARLREQGFGAFEGGSVRQLLRAMVKAGADFTSFDPQDGEAAAAFRTRVADFLAELAVRHPGATVLLVTHHGFIRMTQRLYQEGRGSQSELRELGNASITLAELGPAGIVALREYQPEKETARER